MNGTEIIIRYTIHESLVSRYLQDFESNTFQPYHSAMYISFQYILHNLPNTRLRYISNNDMLSELMSKGLNETDLGCPICSAIQFDVADTGMFVFIRERVYENTHRSTPCNYGGHDLVSAVKAGTDRGIDQYSITGFSWEIWMITAQVILMLSILPFRGIWIKGSLGSVLLNFRDNLWFYFSHLMQNGSENLRPPTSLKIILSVWLMTCLILMNAYSGNLKGTLMVETGSFVDAIEDLLQRKDMILHLAEYSQMTELVQFSEEYEYRSIRMMGEKRKSYFVTYGENYTSMKQSVASGHGVLFYYSPYRNRFAISLNDELRRFGTLLYFGKTKYEYDYDFLIFNKRMGVELLERIDYLSCLVLETAQYQMNLEIEEWKARTILFSTKGAALHAFTAMDVWFLMPVFRIWLFGITLTVLVLFLEMCFSFLNK